MASLTFCLPFAIYQKESALTLQTLDMVREFFAGPRDADWWLDRCGKLLALAGALIVLVLVGIAEVDYDLLSIAATTELLAAGLVLVMMGLACWFVRVVRYTGTPARSYARRRD